MPQKFMQVHAHSFHSGTLFRNYRLLPIVSGKSSRSSAWSSKKTLGNLALLIFPVSALLSPDSYPDWLDAVSLTFVISVSPPLFCHSDASWDLLETWFNFSMINIYYCPLFPNTVLLPFSEVPQLHNFSFIYSLFGLYFSCVLVLISLLNCKVLEGKDGILKICLNLPSASKSDF